MSSIQPPERTPLADADPPKASTSPPKRLDSRREPDAASAGTDSAAARWSGPLVVLGLTLAAVIAVFSETAWSMVNTWWTVGTFGHGFLIPPVSAYLIWRRHELLAAITPSPEFRALPLLLVVAIGWLLGDIAGVNLVKQAALVTMINVVVLAILGWQVVRWILFPLGFLYFAVPFGSFLVPPLQDITAVMSVQMVRWSGVPVFLDGLLIYIPTGSFIVAEACAGVRFLISTIALGFLGAYFFYTSWWRRFAFLGLSLVIPIIANAIRAYLIVMIAHWSDHKLAVGFDHLVYGWIFLSVVTLCLLALGMSFRQDVYEPGPEAVATLPAVRRGSSMRMAVAVAATLALVSAGPAYSSVIESRGLVNEGRVLSPPAVGSAWTSVDDTDLLRVTVDGSDDKRLRTYAAGDRRVQLLTAYYSRQRQGSEVVSESHSFEQGSWLRVGGASRTIRYAGEDLDVESVVLKRGEKGRVVWFWYWVDGQYTSNAIAAKLLEVKAKLFGGRRDAALVAVATDFLDVPEEATPVLEAFVAELGPLDTASTEPDNR